MSSLKEDVVSYAHEIGLDLIGITSADPFDRFLQELDKRAEHYKERYAYRFDKWKTMAQPRKVVPNARSVVVMGFFYLTEEPPPSGERSSDGALSFELSATG